MSSSDGNEKKPWMAGFACEIITPPRGAPLAGYFSPRPNQGINDHLMARAALFQGGRSVVGFLSLDLIFVTGDMVNRIRARLRERGINFADNICVTATHTHTGPYVSSLFGNGPEGEYIDFVVEKAATAVKRACLDLAPVSMRCGSMARNPYAFNRRALLRSGKVLTNAPLGCPDVVGVEGPVDRDIGVIAVGNNGRLTGLVVNITNHCDTTGGDFVSGDWPGHMERFLQNASGYQLPVLTLIGCAGNINHLDWNRSKGERTSGHEVSRRIGSSYGAIVLELLQKLDKAPPRLPRVRKKTVRLEYRNIPPEQIEWARHAIENPDGARSHPLTSEHLAKRPHEQMSFFAEQMLRFQEVRGGCSEDFEVMALKFGRDLAVVALPGEIFSEIGLRIKERSQCKYTFVASLSNGTCGYVPMRESFERGGYEVMPVESGGVNESAAERLEEAAVELLNSESKPVKRRSSG